MCNPSPQPPPVSTGGGQLCGTQPSIEDFTYRVPAWPDVLHTSVQGQGPCTIWATAKPSKPTTTWGEGKHESDSAHCGFLSNSPWSALPRGKEQDPKALSSIPKESGLVAVNSSCRGWEWEQELWTVGKEMGYKSQGAWWRQPVLQKYSICTHQIHFLNQRLRGPYRNPINDSCWNLQ